MPRVNLKQALRERADPIKVESSTRPGTFHELYGPPGARICTCEGFGYQQHCKHADRQNAKDMALRQEQEDEP